VGELEQEYGERVQFVIVPAEETARRQGEIEELGFSDMKHGLVVFDVQGEAAVRMPGHQFGKQEIQAGLEGVLSAGS